MSNANENMVRINTRISKELNEWLNNKSSKTGISKSTLIYLALEQYVQQQQVTQEMPKVIQALELLQAQQGIKIPG